ncbi:hypothetical protein A0H81_09056 [Grifola frondosa]|uniref:Uncharacterized protein n=1 Tax=Grifola frondosa TaxID=5627 RepID=A0A1C7M2V2_GRIFR|nr:hypothetical protein A0H81_09056 [Grifola frondosa]
MQKCISQRVPGAKRRSDQRTGTRNWESAHFLPLDLGDLSVVKKSAEEFNSRESSLHGLILNAGVMMRRETSSLRRVMTCSSA